jgi:GAF domain-containing protein
MTEQSPLAESLAALTRFFVGDQTVADTLDRIAHLGVEAIAPADEIGITMLVGGKVKTAFFTDPEVVEIDQAQYATGEGPCLQAFRDGTIHRVDATRTDERFPSFSAACVAHGILSTLSMPMNVGGEPVGAFNVYARAERAFGEDDEQAAERFSSQAAIVVANASAYWDAHQLTLDLEAALRSRAVIEQAKGILMASQRCSADEAFQVMVRASQRENIKLRDIAARIVANVGSPRPPGSDGTT